MQPTCRQVPPRTLARLDERDLEAVLPAANGGRVAGRPAADDCHVVEGVGMVSAKGYSVPGVVPHWGNARRTPWFSLMDGRVAKAS